MRQHTPGTLLPQRSAVMTNKMTSLREMGDPLPPFWGPPPVIDGYSRHLSEHSSLRNGKCREILALFPHLRESLPAPDESETYGHPPA
jgi:hypothetical protein